MKLHLGIAAAAAISLALFAPPRSVVINGKTYAKAAIEQGGKTYVSLEALKSAGAQTSVSGGAVSIGFLPLGGRNQVDAVEGKLEEWIQNTLWRIRVESVEPAPNPFGRGPGFVAKVTLRNLSPRPISPFASGLDKISIIDSEQQVFSFNQQSFKHFFQDIAPGGEVQESILFGDSANKISRTGEVEKLMVFFRSSGGKKAKDFRIFLMQT